MILLMTNAAWCMREGASRTGTDRESQDMWRPQPNRWEAVPGLRLTEEPTLYGLVIRERGELIEFVSFAEARRRQEAAMRMAKPMPEKGAGTAERHSAHRVGSLARGRAIHLAPQQELGLPPNWRVRSSCCDLAH